MGKSGDSAQWGGDLPGYRSVFTRTKLTVFLTDKEECLSTAWRIFTLPLAPAYLDGTWSVWKSKLEGDMRL